MKELHDTFYFLPARYILQDDICSADPEKHKVYSEVLGPAYLTLVDLLMTKSMITVNQSDWTSEDKENFRCYRQVNSISLDPQSLDF